MIDEGKFDDKLAKAIKGLKEFEPASNAWIKIASQLDFEEKLENKVAKLPQIEVDIGAWRNIENKLNKGLKGSIRKLVFYSLSAAASVLVFFGAAMFLLKNQDSKIVYTQEYVLEDEAEIQEPAQETDPIKYLEENCRRIPEVCQTPEFLEQKRMLLELDNEHKQLTEVINKYGESPELIKSLIKIENLKSRIMKDLIKTVNS